ncbi:GAF and ANTAR domain-containing protein [Microbacterium sp. LRZ72]|uniref:GAF and ANTAR domain-containing protein n=1 Tax=Microbacterium sp. LRZ72 TaxID=2942481 RepID=UPI0029A1DB69|nr:GAF and ANTAR domain-containing protein [Microbacterium sp. LRZ72]MDX2376723.1 GAF and ANTAR domain-containing protein [Microbacterium sp. LRZ72]
MNATEREARLVRTFAALADSLTTDFDIVDLLQMLVETCVDLFDVDAAGVLLVDGGDRLELVASTSEETRLVETMQLAAEAGPCIECFETGLAVSVAHIDEVPDKWSRFRTRALEQGFSALDALPMRLRQHRIGTLNLLRVQPGPAPEDDLIAAQAFADVVTISILHERSLREKVEVADQLQKALQSRVVIEQAKGVVSHTHDVPIDVAFTMMRDYARSNQLPLSETAARIVARTLDLPR